MVHDDPVNLMGYVTWVFMRVFGYPEARAAKLMMEVHTTRPLGGLDRRTGKGGVLRPTTSVLPTPRDDRKGRVMKMAPTLDGGLRIDAESPGDWDVLRAVVPDAVARGEDLAARLGILTDGRGCDDDWHEYVVPESARAVRRPTGCGGARGGERGGGGRPRSWFAVDPAQRRRRLWYGALNQARLALRTATGSTTRRKLRRRKMPAAKRSAWFRSQFYLALQGFC